MKPTQPEILAYVLKTVQDLCQDWDYADPVGPESLLFTGLGMESLDAVVLCTAIQEHYQTTMPFAELLADIGQKQRDLSIAELAEFAGHQRFQADLDLTGTKSSVFHKLDPAGHMDLTRVCGGLTMIPYWRLLWPQRRTFWWLGIGIVTLWTICLSGRSARL